MKALSFDDKSTLVRRAFYDMVRPEDDYWLDVVDVYDEYAVISVRPATWYQVPYTLDGATVVIAPVEEWEAVTKEWVAAKGLLISPFSVVKAITSGDEWALDVLGNPYGSPLDKDADGEYFDGSTQFHFEEHGLPVVVTYHGLNPDTGKWDKPAEYVGKAVSVETRSDGVWYRVVLNKASQLAKQLWESARKGLVRASTGSIPQLARVGDGGHVDHWPVAELSLIDLSENFMRPKNKHAVAIPAVKAMYEEAGLTVPLFISDGGTKPETGPEGRTPGAPVEQGRLVIGKAEHNEDIEVNEQELQKAINDRVEAAMKARLEAEAAAAQAKADEEARIKAEVEKQVAAAKAEFAKVNRLPYADGEGIPAVAKYRDLWKYDNLDAADAAILVSVLKAGQKRAHSEHGASPALVKAAAVKLIEDKGRIGEVGKQAMIKAEMPMKADEIQQQDLTSYGDEWVGVAYSQAIWDAIRIGTFVANRLPSIEVPPGHESIFLPLEGADPTFYKVAESTDFATNAGVPVRSVPSSKMGTGRVQLTLAKMGAAVPWSGELEEDSLIPFVSQLRQQLTVAGQEQLEHAIIDGDTTLTASTNINHIAGTPTNELYTLFNGFRKSPLVTTTANSRAGGVLDVSDFLETLKLMGAAGANAIDMAKVSFILDMNTNWKAMELPEVKTKDVNTQATVENGRLKNIFGYGVDVSAFMHYASAVRKANTSGKVDQSSSGANNTTGSILAVRWDQWLLGYRRRMSIETTRFANSDVTEIVCLARLGLIQRDTEASAISYGLTV